MKAIEYQIHKIISESTSHKGINTCNDLKKREICNVEGNGFCADCNSPSKWTAGLWVHGMCVFVFRKVYVSDGRGVMVVFMIRGYESTYGQGL